jgi:hypothetical protein
MALGEESLSSKATKELSTLPRGFRVCFSDDDTCPFAGYLGADDGTRTHDLLHGKRVVGSIHLSC